VLQNKRNPSLEVVEYGIFYIVIVLFFAFFFVFDIEITTRSILTSKKEVYQVILEPNCVLQSSFAIWWRTSGRQNAYTLHRSTLTTGATVRILSQQSFPSKDFSGGTVAAFLRFQTQ
jgi:hypothetical protein